MDDDDDDDDDDDGPLGRKIAGPLGCACFFGFLEVLVCLSAWSPTIRVCIILEDLVS